MIDERLKTLDVRRRWQICAGDDITERWSMMIICCVVLCWVVCSQCTLHKHSLAIRTSEECEHAIINAPIDVACIQGVHGFQRVQNTSLLRARDLLEFVEIFSSSIYSTTGLRRERHMSKSSFTPLRFGLRITGLSRL